MCEKHSKVENLNFAVELCSKVLACDIFKQAEIDNSNNTYILKLDLITFLNKENT